MEISLEPLVKSPQIHDSSSKGVAHRSYAPKTVGTLSMVSTHKPDWDRKQITGTKEWLIN